MTLNPLLLAVIDVLSDETLVPPSREADLLCLQVSGPDQREAH